jgi:dTDP-4-amino-4,6-dideoxygalactose transaminase
VVISAKNLSQGKPPAIVVDEPAAVSGARVSVPDAATVAASVAKILASGTLTNGATVRELEGRAATYLGVRHCIATGSGTAAMTLALGALDAAGEAAMSAFASPSTLHAVRSAGFDPVFADVDPETLAITPDTVAERVGTRTGVIVASHPFGAPCDAEGLTSTAGAHGVRIVFDAASAFGSERAGRKVGGFGDAEVFSLSSTKMLVAGEGGLIATDDDLFAERCRRARDGEERGRHTARLVCMSARMSELHAAVALASFDTLDERLRWRRGLANRYRDAVGDVPGLSFPPLAPGDLSTHHECVALIDPSFGREAAHVAASLRTRGVDAHLTCATPLHRSAMNRSQGGTGRLPGTETVAAQAVSLPIWDRMEVDELFGVVRALRACRTETVLT